MSISELSLSIHQELGSKVKHLNKAAHRKLSQAIAAVLSSRSSNTSVIAEFLTVNEHRKDMQEQWLARLLDSDSYTEAQVYEAYAIEILRQAHIQNKTIVIAMDQTDLSDKHAILMLSVPYKGRSKPLLWSVKEGAANIGSKEQIDLLNTVITWLPQDCKPILMADRFYPSEELFNWLINHDWGWRIRLKSNFIIKNSLNELKTVGDFMQQGHETYEPNALLFEAEIPISFGAVWDIGKKEGWAIACNRLTDINRDTVLDYSKRWSIEPLFSDLKSRGFDLHKSQMKLSKRLSKLLLLIAIALAWLSRLEDVTSNTILKKRDPTNQ